MSTELFLEDCFRKGVIGSVSHLRGDYKEVRGLHNALRVADGLILIKKLGSR